LKNVPDNHERIILIIACEVISNVCINSVSSDSQISELSWLNNLLE